MFGPTSWAFLCVLIAGFAGLLYWLARSRQIAIKAGAGVLAFALASLFGASLVNQYYSYFTTWGSLFADASGSGVVSYATGFGHGASDSPPYLTARTVSKHERAVRQFDEPPAFSAPPPAAAAVAAPGAAFRCGGQHRHPPDRTGRAPHDGQRAGCATRVARCAQRDHTQGLRVPATAILRARLRA